MDNMDQVLDEMMDHDHHDLTSDAGFPDDNYHHSNTGIHDAHLTNDLVPTEQAVDSPDSDLYDDTQHPDYHALQQPDVFLDDQLGGVGTSDWNGDPLHDMHEVRFPPMNITHT